MLTCIRVIPIQGGVFRETVPFVIRSVTGERSNVRYNANNTRKLETEKNVSYRSYTKRSVEVEV